MMKTIIQPNQHSAILAKWRGSDARIWIFDISLTRLCLRLARLGDPEVLYIIGVSCEHIVGPFSWSDSEVSIILQKGSGGSSDLVADKKASFTLQCHGIVMAVGPAGELKKTLQNFLGDEPSAQTSLHS
jgi:hypothetical protein